MTVYVECICLREIPGVIKTSDISLDDAISLRMCIHDLTALQVSSNIIDFRTFVIYLTPHPTHKD